MNEKKQLVFADKYRDIRNSYSKLSTCVKNIVSHSIPEECNIHSIESRAKSNKSFTKKCLKLNDTNDDYKYQSPLKEITDLAGVRVIAFFPKSLPLICKAIEENFIVEESKDIGEERFDQGKIGYKSIHYIVKLPSERTEFAEYREFEGLVAEIQVRTILQHAWAEMEHDIQYKSSEQLPRNIRKRFISLAGMLEIADREFQAIQDEDNKIRSSVKASLDDDLSVPATKADIDKSKDHENPEKAKSAQEMMRNGQYSKAIDFYSKKIDESPNFHSLYIGRAKAYFLSGRRSNAIEDLEKAASLSPNDPNVKNLKSKIEDGILTNSSYAKEAWQMVSSANEFLSQGNGEEAFKLYSQAQSLGFNSIFSSYNKAMACILTKDHHGADYFLNFIRPTTDSPMEVNFLALKAIISAISNQGYKKSLQVLKNKLSDLEGFQISQSPIRYLEQGFINRDSSMKKNLANVFEQFK